MADLGPPKAGGPKTASSCNTKWKQLRKLHDYILQAKQKTYPGASGWTYSDDKGFNVTNDTREAWNNFSKAHPHFKPFATSGWALFDQMHEILPSRARGQHVFNAASSHGVDQDLILALQSQEDTNDPTQSSENGTQSSTDSSQPFSDWSQTNFGDSQASDPVTPSSTSFPASISTPVSTLKRPTPDEFEAPWSGKRNRVSGPEAILHLSRSVDGIGNVLRECFMPKSSSAISPTKKISQARTLAMEDMKNGYILAGERTQLSILFGRDVTAADAYIAEDDGFNRADVAHALLNPTHIV
ncbi:hypothetical protein B0H19DRAFT_1255053 [Mycena capillaripes]|nr:hypothetical protein B0H19DRAFT_1255053 [Mycena capillaripes]